MTTMYKARYNEVISSLKEKCANKLGNITSWVTSPLTRPSHLIPEERLGINYTALLTKPLVEGRRDVVLVF